MELKYVANQITPEGLDEIQRILLAHSQGQHIALAGPPGVGKTDCVVNLPKIVERPLFDITCDSFMTESPLVGFPELEGNGSTSTKWRNGVAAEAAQQNGIFYGDEFDLLQGSVQKRLNSLFDDRRSIRRRDGEVIKAGDSFVGIISYNPSERLAKRELEEAVADRFVHLPFGYLPSKLEAAIAVGNMDGLQVERRGVLGSGDKMRFIVEDGKSWKDMFTGNKVTHPDGATVYRVVKDNQQQEEAPTKMSEREFAEKTTEFFGAIRTFAEQGTNKLSEPIKQYLKEIGEVTNVPLHKPSTRIVKNALAQYRTLAGLGMKPELAQAYAARLCVDQICYGKFGERSLGQVTVREAVHSLAQFYKLLGKPRQRTDFGA